MKEDATPLRNDTCTIPCFNEKLVGRVKSSLPDEQDIRRVASLHRALADTTRLKILMALGQGELCVCDIAHVIGLSISATSHQLRQLRNLNLVTYRSDGRMVYYSLVGGTQAIVWVEESLARNRQQAG
ncbi:MAG TPA: metalloregulator ArsR/SmtB family transcription factor [Geobacteraceae bacterium]